MVLNDEFAHEWLMNLSLSILKTPNVTLDHKNSHKRHGAHTREEQEHADEDLNSNNSL